MCIAIIKSYDIDQYYLFQAFYSFVCTFIFFVAN